MAHCLLTVNHKPLSEIISQPTTAAVERSFSILGKLFRKDRKFLPENVEKYLSFSTINFNFLYNNAINA